MVGTEAGWSPVVQELLDYFLKSLTLTKRVEFTHLVTAMLREREQRVLALAGETLPKTWENYLAQVTPGLVKDGLWGELKGMWIFISDYPHVIDHERLAQIVEDPLGPNGRAEYQRHVDDFKKRVGSYPVM